MINDNDVVGLPSIDGLKSYDIAQGYGDTCAIRCQQLVLKDFGVDLMQEQLMAEARARGWYIEHGTPPEDVGNLLELHGVGVSHYHDANLADLTKALAEGRKVIVGVDAGELLGHSPLDDSATDLGANHALIVAGVDTSDPDDVRVILTDPGTGDVAKSYSFEEFNAAWRDSRNEMVVTNDPVPGLPNFDAAAGHVTGTISGLPYDAWCAEHQDEFTHPYQVGYDSDGNGTIDAWDFDVNQDGIVDERHYDLNDDGAADCRAFDSDADGLVDSFASDADVSTDSAF